MGLEREIESRLKREVERQGGWCLKFLSSVAGVPDRLCLFPWGKAVFVELKAPGKKPRPLQQRQMARIRNLGFQVYVIDSKKGIDEFMEDMKARG